MVTHSIRSHADHAYGEVVFRFVSAAVDISTISPTAYRRATGPNGELLTRRVAKYDLTIRGQVRCAQVMVLGECLSICNVSSLTEQPQICPRRHRGTSWSDRSDEPTDTTTRRRTIRHFQS